MKRRSPTNTDWLLKVYREVHALEDRKVKLRKEIKELERKRKSLDWILFGGK